MPRILHFADAHIDIAAHGRHDPQTGLPVRVLDFLKALDTIVDTAVVEQVDLVLFAGDAYKDRTPAPTFQREWGKRMMRLSAAGIRTLLLVGNHDLSPAAGRATALQEYETLQVPHIFCVQRPAFLKPEQLEGLPLQVLALPWVTRSSLMAALNLGDAQPNQVYAQLEARLKELVGLWLEEANPALPVVLAAHASVEGATYGGERAVMLGGDLVLSGSLVRDPRLDYVALGHIHKAQNLNEGLHPPVVYSGSIERVDFGEAADDKFFVIAQVERGKTQVEWRKLDGRRYIDRTVTLESELDFQTRLPGAIPPHNELQGAIFRLVVNYPRQWNTLLDEAALRQQAQAAFEFHLVRRPQLEARLRLPDDQAISSLPACELLDLYWQTMKVDGDELDALQKLAQEIIAENLPDSGKSELK
ncbi:MAG: exonuclease SbcCD subunit D [Anaerolineaceae bacterium]|jgi:exonuclease SbcD